jgi:hypothetical protein
MATADVNGDGLPDVIAAAGDRVSLFLGRSDGTLGPKTDILTGTIFNAVAVADFNSDGKPDIAVADYGATRNTRNLIVLLGDGKGGFSVSAAMPLFSILSIVVGDFNKDGKPDIAVAQGQGAGVFSVFLGQGNGTFGARADFPNNGDSGDTLARTARAIETADLNRDGNLDIVLANTITGYITVFLGDGTGRFRLFQFTQLGLFRPLSLAVGDFDRDGNPDLVVTSIGSPTVSVLFGDGTGDVFNRRIDLPIVGNHHPSVVTADFDGDGVLDIAISNVSGGNSGDLGVSVFGGDGKGGFSKRVDFRTGTSSVYSLSIADLNGDRRPDLVFGSNTLIGVLPNTTSSHRTWIDAVQNAASSNVGPISPGEIITLYGKGIGPKRLVGIQLDSAGLVSKATAGTQVLFDGVPAPIVYTWATQVSAIVPYAPRFPTV